MSNEFDIPEKDAGTKRQYREFSVPDGTSLPVAVDFKHDEYGDVEIWAIWYGSLNLCLYIKDAAKASLAWAIERELEAEARVARAEMRAQIHADAWGA